MWGPQEEKDEEAIDVDSEEEVDEEEADGLAELPQKRKPVKSETKRMSKLSSLFDKGNKGKLNKVEQKARDLANPDGTINPEAALDNVRRSRRLMIMIWGLGLLVFGSIITILVQASKNRATVNEGTVEVKDAISKSTSTSVGMDNNGHSVLQDVHTSQQVSVRGFGDPFATKTKVDPITGRRLSCMDIGEVAELFHDAVSRTEASITFMDENGIEIEVVPVNGHFVDHGRTLHFGTGKDSVTMIMDSDVCNTGVLPTDLEDVQDDSQVEPHEGETGDGALLEDEDEQDSDTGVFKRGLREPSSAVAVIPVNLSRREVLDRHRNEFAMAKDAVSSGRKMNTVGSVEAVQGDNDSMSTLPLIIIDTSQSIASSKVRIQSKVTTALNLAEVEVYDSTGTNVALNKNATQSSTYSGHWSHDFPASKAVNGARDDFTHTNDETEPYWEVDLGAVYQVQRVIIYNRWNNLEFWAGWYRLSNSVVSLIKDDVVKAVYDIGDASNLSSVELAASDFASIAPTLSPTSSPTLNPTKAPTLSPTSSPTLNPTKAPTLSPTTSPTLSPTKTSNTDSTTPTCTMSEGYSDGSAGDLIIDANGIITLDGNPITSDSRFFDSTTLGTARDAITTFENINNFIIHAGQTVNVLGTVEIKAVGFDIQQGATLNGSGGGYAGGARRTSNGQSDRTNGSGPPNTNGKGQGGYTYTGGAGAGHGGNGGQGGWQNSYNARAYGGSSYDTTLPSVELQPGSGGGGGSGDDYGGSGGYGGAGGAAIRLFAVDTIALNGTILSNGENGEGCSADTCGYSGGGGGSGGSISLSACTLDAGSSSLVQANGGAGGRSRDTSFPICGGGGGGGGVIKTESTNTIGTLVLQVDGGSPPSGGRKPGAAGSVGKVFLTDNLEVEASCDHPSYLDTSSPLDKNSRCASVLCRSSDNMCGCLVDDDCSSGLVCHSDNKCYSSGLSYEQDCSADNGDDVDARCTSGKCRSSDNMCGCIVDDDCSSGEACHTDNKCYSSGLSYEQDCSADNGDRVEARCTSGKCRSSDNMCGCIVDDDCPSDKVCKTSTNTCETQVYMLAAYCDLGVSGEGTNSKVSLEVKQYNGNVDYIDEMETQSLEEGENGRCPVQAFEIKNGQEPDEYEIEIHGDDALGVDYFVLYDSTNPGEIKRWGADVGNTREGWCFSTDGREGCFSGGTVRGAYLPYRGIILHNDNNLSVDLIKFSGGSRCEWSSSCSSGSCVEGGGSCGIFKKCCSPG